MENKATNIAYSSSLTKPKVHKEETPNLYVYMISPQLQETTKPDMGKNELKKITEILKGCTQPTYAMEV